MKASVIIPSYNREHILRLSLQSLSNQVDIAKKDFEVVVCDDGSSDGTRAMLEEFKDKLQLQYFYQEDKGYRVSLARNTGMRAAKSEVIILLDAGVVVGTNFITAHLAQHANASYKTVVNGYIYGYNYTMRSDDLTDDFDFDHPDKSIAALAEKNAHLDLREENYRLVNSDLSQLPAPWSLFWTTNVSFTKTFVDEVGMFDERFVSWGVEDVELGYRFTKHGGVYVLSREACGLHYPHERDRSSQKSTNTSNKAMLYEFHPDEIIKRYLASTALSFNFELLKEESDALEQSFVRDDTLAAVD